MTPEQRAKNYFCGGNEPMTPYEKGIVDAVSGLIRQAVLEEVSGFISEAVEQEREACAEIVLLDGGPDGDINYEVAERLAQRIRNRSGS